MAARSFRFAPLFAAGLAGFLPALPPAQATVIEAAGTPARIAVAATGPAAVSVSWRVVRQEVDLPNPGTVSSPRLRILIGGAVAANLARPLARDLAGAANLETVVIPEVVQIPEALVFRAVKQRAVLQVERDFSDSPGDSPVAAELQVTPSGPGSVAVAVERLALSFSDDTRTQVVAQGSELHAVAEINTQGVGLLTGWWEVASGATTAGTPVFQSLALVRQGVAGGGRTVITSPRLPVGAEGTHLVRFRLVEPAPAFALPELQYYVTPGLQDDAPATPLALVVSGPAPGVVLAPGTRFAWQPVAGASAYRVAFYATPAGPAAPLDPAAFPAPGGTAPQGEPLAGMAVPGDRSAAVAEAATLALLPGERSYLWQVIAFDANGAVVGSSSLREIHKP